MPEETQKERRRRRRKERRRRKGGGGGDGGGGNYKKGPIAQEASKKWAEDVLTGKADTNPYFKRLMKEEEGSVYDNPELRNITDQIKRELQEDWLGEQAANAEQAEAGGRYGGGMYQAMRVRTNEETQEAAGDAISRMLAGAYENKQQRRAGLVSNLFNTQASAARVPIEFGQLDVQRGQLGVARGQLALGRSEFAFNKKMALLGAQQDAVNDYMQLLMGYGSMGGTQQGPGEFIPTQNPYGAALMGGMGGYMAAGGTFGGGQGMAAQGNYGRNYGAGGQVGTGFKGGAGI